MRLRWTEGGIAFGLGKDEEAEAAFREVQAEFLSLNMDYNAALVSLDLAVLLSKQGRGGELKRLAVDLAREIYRECLAAITSERHLVAVSSRLLLPQLTGLTCG